MPDFDLNTITDALIRPNVIALIVGLLILISAITIKRVFGKSYGFRSINLPESSMDFSHVTLHNHFLLLAASSAGKTKSVIWNLISRQMSEKECNALVVYDFKFDPKTSLSAFVYTKSLEEEVSIPTRYLNFHRPAYSIRCNPFASIEKVEDAFELAEALVKNFNAGQRENSFWQKSAMAILGATIFFFHKRDRKMCTLPHCIELITALPASQMIELVAADDDCRRLLSPVTAGLSAPEQLAGQYSSLAADLSRFCNENVYFVLGDGQADFTFDLNQGSPRRLVIANDPQNLAFFSPLVGLCLTAAFRAMMKPTAIRSSFILDEAGTVLIPDLEKKVATVRDPYKISIDLITQDYAQLENLYGRPSAQTIRGSCNNKGFGKLTEGLEYVQSHFGTYKVREKSTNTNSSGGSGASYSTKDVPRVKTEYMSQLGPGEFIFDSDNRRFKQKFKMLKPDLFELPEQTYVDRKLLKTNFDRIKAEVASL